MSSKLELQSGAIRRAKGALKKDKVEDDERIGGNYAPLLDEVGAPWYHNGWYALMALLIFLGVLAALGMLGYLVHRETTEECMKDCGSVSIPCSTDCVDFIIVGAGAAGCAAARRLSDDGTYSVLVLEAGEDNYDDAAINDPDNALFELTANYFTKYFWQMETIPQTSVGDRIFKYTNGRILGGGTSVNGLQVTRGTAAYWDEIDDMLGNPGTYSAANMFLTFKDLENFSSSGHWFPGPTRGDGTLTSQTWAVVARPVNESDDSAYLISTMSAGYGIPEIDDYNDPDTPLGPFRYWQLQERWDDTPDFRRETSQKAFLGPTVMDPLTYLGVGTRQLRVRVRSQVLGLIWDPSDGTHCVGARYVDNNNPDNQVGTVRAAYARHTVIMSANLFDAMYLQLEGIGPAATLAAAGVAPRVINERVGRNCTNHVGVGFVFLAPNVTGDNPDTLPGDLYPGGGAFTEDPSQFGTPGRRGMQHIFLTLPGIFIDFMIQTTPLSQGTLDIYDKDVLKPPRVDMGYFTNPDDLEIMRDSARQFYANMNGEDPSIVSAQLNLTEWADNTTLNEFILENMAFAHHWSGSCRMATSSEEGVVDVRNRVYGTTGLRVCDTSIFPKIVDNNLGTPATAIGDICARLLLEDVLAGVA
jgi:choline dehydrogenase